MHKTGDINFNGSYTFENFYCPCCPYINYVYVPNLANGLTYYIKPNVVRSTDDNKEPRLHFTTDEALLVGRSLGVDWTKFDVEQYRMGMDVELEHGRQAPHTNITNDDPLITGKIALAHLNEFPDYYLRLNKMEKEAAEYWNKKDDEE